MASRKKRRQRRATIIGAIIGSIIIFTFVLSLTAPDLGRRSSSSGDDVVFNTPPPTPLVAPTPDPNPQLTGQPPYIHSSGYFQTFRPAGADWIIDEGEPVNASATARVVIQSPRRLVVIHNYIQPGVQYETPAALSTGYLTPEHFAGAWIDYDSWEEIGRRIVDDRVIVDFELVSQGIDYLGRSTSSLLEDWLFVSRIIVPANNPDLLALLDELVTPAFTGFAPLLALPVDWPAYIDQRLGFVLKHPATWAQVAGSPGRPVTFNLPSGNTIERVRLYTEADQLLASPDDAEAWVRNAENVESIQGIEPVEREAGRGYLVAYQFIDTAGDPHSGLVALLNDDAQTLFVANLQIEPAGINLLDADTVPDDYTSARQSLVDGLLVLPDGARVPAQADE